MDKININGPLVSVAMATYNGGKYLKRQLDSIFSQSYRNIEVIVTDDCSTDETEAILLEFSKTGRLRYWKNESKLGFRDNFVKAISLCRGEYIALSDQDDIWCPEKIETLINEIGNSSLIFSSISVIDSSDGLVAASFSDYVKRRMPREDEYRVFLEFQNFVTGCASLFKKELVREICAIPTYEAYHDWWIARVAARRKGIKYFDKPLIYYRRHGKNVSDITDSSLTSRIYKCLKFENRRRWIEKYLLLRDLLEQRFKNETRNDNEEKRALQQAISYLSGCLDGRLQLRPLCNGFRLRKFIYMPPWHFWPKTLAMFLVAIESKFFRCKTH